MKLKNIIRRSISVFVAVTALVLSNIVYAETDSDIKIPNEMYLGTYNDLANTGITEGTYYNSFINISNSKVYAINVYYGSKNVTSICYSASISDSKFTCTSTNYWYCDSDGVRTSPVYYNNNMVLQGPVTVKIGEYIDIGIYTGSSVLGHTFRCKK